MPYDLIMADPPWNEQGGGKSVRGAQRHYPLMTTPEILRLHDHVWAWSKPDAMLMLWVTNNFLPDGLLVMASWGFTYKTNIAWFKEGNAGLGFYARGAHELCLIGVQGRPERSRQASPADRAKFDIPHSAFHAPRGKHSQKPEYIYDIADGYALGGKKLEMFARRRRPGWDVWGNEVVDEIQSE